MIDAHLGQPAAQTPALASGALWFKAADPAEKAYAAGFADPLPVTVLAQGFVPPLSALNLAAALGLDGTTLSVEIEGGGLSNAPGSALPAAFTLAPNYALTVAEPAGGVPWSGKVVKGDGAFSGTLTLPAGPNHLAGKAGVSGVLLPGLTGGDAGVGLVRVPVAGARGAFRTASLLLQR